MLGVEGCFQPSNGYGVFGSISTPLSDNGLQLQLDAQVSSNADGDLGGEVGAQVYKRIPNRGLYGVSAAYRAADAWGREDGFRLAGVAELYSGNMTFSGKFGWDFAEEEAFGEARISAYLGQNTKIYGGYLQDGQGYGFVGAEHMFTPSISAFMDGYSGNDEEAVKAGLKLHFGGKSSSASTRSRGAERTLISRDREEFIPLWMQPCAVVPASADVDPQPTEEPGEQTTEPPGEITTESPGETTSKPTKPTTAAP